MTLHIVYGLLALAAGIAAYRLAEAMGRSARGWMIASVFFLLPAKEAVAPGRPGAA